MGTTPKFHVTQTAAWVFIHVHVPFVRVSEMEVYVDGRDFSFYCKPYLLKLHFPHEVVDNELAKAVYDPNKVESNQLMAICMTSLGHTVNVADAMIGWVCLGA